jgi:uncharacterized protein YbjT (DUF2867 family)
MTEERAGGQARAGSDLRHGGLSEALFQEEGHKVRALVRNPAKLISKGPELEVHQGSITDDPNLDELV